MQFNEEQKALYKTVKEFGENEILPFVEDWEKNGSFPAHELFKKMGNLDLLGITKDEEYGGIQVQSCSRCRSDAIVFQAYSGQHLCGQSSKS